jgi:vacuolar-type H+-ATPase subunit H
VIIRALREGNHVVSQGASPSDNLIEAAITRVLEAEREAHAATEGAREQASVRIESARSRGIEIARRAERWIGRYQAAIEQRVQAEGREIEVQISALAHATGEDPQILRREAEAVEHLAAELTGGDHD